MSAVSGCSVFFPPFRCRIFGVLKKKVPYSATLVRLGSDPPPPPPLRYFPVPFTHKYIHHRFCVVVRPTPFASFFLSPFRSVHILVVPTQWLRLRLFFGTFTAFPIFRLAPPPTAKLSSFTTFYLYIHPFTIHNEAAALGSSIP